MIQSRAMPRPYSERPRLCDVDPITLTGLALAAGGGIAASQSLTAKPQAAAAPVAPPTPPPPQQQAQAKPVSTQGSQPTFLGGAATPPVQSGQKSLLGQ